MAIVTQRSGLPEELDCEIQKDGILISMVVDPRPSRELCHYAASTLGLKRLVKEFPPVELDGEDGFLLNPPRMQTGHPYPFSFRGHELWAVKEDDGTVSIYVLPE